MAVSMLLIGCRKQSVSNSLTGTKWKGGVYFESHHGTLNYDAVVQFSSNSSGSYTESMNGRVETYIFTYSYSGNKGTVSGAPFSYFTISGNTMTIDRGITDFDGYFYGTQTLKKQF